MADPIVLSRAALARGNERALSFTQLETYMAEQYRDANLLVASGIINEISNEKGLLSKRLAFFGGASLAYNSVPPRRAPGQLIEAQSDVQDYTDLTIDDSINLARRVPVEDEEDVPWDAIKPRAKDLARQHAEYEDYVGFRVLVLASRAPAIAGVHSGGIQLTRDVASVDLTDTVNWPRNNTSAETLIGYLSDASEQADRMNWPTDPNCRYMFADPSVKTILLAGTRVTSKDFIPVGDSPIVNRKVENFMGWNIVFTKHLPNSNVTTDLTKYNGDFSGGSITTGRPIMVGACKDSEDEGPVAIMRKGEWAKAVFNEDTETTLVKHRKRWGMGIHQPWKALSVALY